MLPALLTMVGLAAAAGAAAALAARRSNEDKERLIDEIDALLPQTQCGRCTFSGCRPYATALANGAADINQCPPGGDATAAALAKLLGREPRPVDPRFGSVPDPSARRVDRRGGVHRLREMHSGVPCRRHRRRVALHAHRHRCAVHRLRAVHPALPRRLHRHATRPGGRAATWPARSDSRDYARAGDVTMARTSGCARRTAARCAQGAIDGAAAPDREPVPSIWCCPGSARRRSRQCRSSAPAIAFCSGSRSREPGGTISAWLHSPVSGTVAAIEPRPAPHHLGAPALSIVIANDGTGRAPRRRRRPSSFEHLSARAAARDIWSAAASSAWAARSFPRPSKLDARRCRQRAATAPQRRRVRAVHQLRRHADARARAGRRVRRADPAARARRRDLHRSRSKTTRRRPLAALRSAVDRGARRANPDRGRAEHLSGGRRAPADHGGVRRRSSVRRAAADVGILCQNVGDRRCGGALGARRAAADQSHRHGDRRRRASSRPISKCVSARRFRRLIADCGGYTERMTRLIMGGSMMGAGIAAR